MVHHIIKKLLVAVNQRISFLWESKYYVKIRCIQYVFTAFVHPFFFRQYLTHGTASVTAGIIVNLRVTTVFADTYIGTIGSGLTVDNTVGNTCLPGRGSIFFKIFWIKMKENILYSRLIHWRHLYSCQRDF